MTPLGAALFSQILCQTTCSWLADEALFAVGAPLVEILLPAEAFIVTVSFMEAGLVVVESLLVNTLAAWIPYCI